MMWPNFKVVEDQQMGTVGVDQPFSSKYFFLENPKLTFRNLVLHNVRDTLIPSKN
jgi:hypothetical protein